MVQCGQCGVLGGYCYLLQRLTLDPTLELLYTLSSNPNLTPRNPNLAPETRTSNPAPEPRTPNLTPETYSELPGPGQYKRLDSWLACKGAFNETVSSYSLLPTPYTLKQFQ